jgi:hypothetical protein
MKKKNLYNLWPILYFDADWPAESYSSFDFDVRLVKANDDILAILKKPESYDHGEAMYAFSGYTEWFLALPSPKPTEHVSSSEIGISFEVQLQQAIVDSFLLCLKLIRQTAATCPLKVRNVKIEDEGIDLDTFENALDDYHGINTDKPTVFMPESFHLEDLHLLTELWSSIIELRKLGYWANRIYKEEFFAACDKEAGEDVVKEIVDSIMSSPVYLGLPSGELKKHRKFWRASCKEALVKGQLDEFLRKSFEKVFLQKQNEVFSNRTRIGRALNLFFEGLKLPLQHSCLSMCLVLETIFTVEDAEITYQFSTRLANITGKNFEDRKDIFERAKKLYSNRSHLVHGRKSIETVEPNILKDSFFFARQSLQHILLRDDKLLKLYSDPITSDKTKDSDKAVKAIKNYFRNLDLR